MRVFIYTIRPGKERKDAIEVDHGAEENPDPRVVDQEHQSMRYSIISVAVERWVDHALDELLEAADLGSGARGLTAHEYQ